jgi:diguanylate cyclase (GGDEF)-like protein
MARGASGSRNGHNSPDPLTGLPTRVFFENRLNQALVEARRSGKMIAVVLLDLDRFRKTNHSLSHALGDVLLQNVARRLQHGLKSRDLLARLGGDEFLLMKEINRAEEAIQTAEHIVDSIQLPFHIEESEVHLTASVGVSLFPQDGSDPEVLLRNADAALTRAKEQGKNTYQFYHVSMTTEDTKRLTLENSLRRALKENEFTVYYQPQVDLRSGQILGMEALVRWQIPGFAVISPKEFITVAEDTGLIVPIGQWVLHTACAQNKAWQDQGLGRLCVAVNLSARQFQQKDLVKMIGQALGETGLEGNCLELEITESYAMRNPDFTMTVLRELKNMGVRVSIDDFGTGYSSLSYLKQFPIDTLKIDRTFVKDLPNDPNDVAIAAAIIVLAHNLKLQVIAEGVESAAQLAILKKHRCDRMQGYLFSRPLPADAFEALLKEKKSLPVAR